MFHSSDFSGFLRVPPPKQCLILWDERFPHVDMEGGPPPHHDGSSGTSDRTSASSCPREAGTTVSAAPC